MKKFLLLIYIIIIIFVSINCKEKKYNHTNRENNLYFVFSTFRHGARKPFNKYDVFKNKIKNSGSLTSYGKKQHLIIGQKNRDRYFNFLNLGSKKFNTEQILVRSSKVKRVLLSTQIQLQGLLNSKDYNDIIQTIKLKPNLFILYNINIKNNTDIYTYHKTSCENLRKLTPEEDEIKYINKYKTNILPIFETCYGKFKPKKLILFCDDVISAYFEYMYESKKTNNIGKCNINIINKINNFCIDYFDSIRDWSEINAYYFYTFFIGLFKYMKDAVDGNGKTKMILIGGHDSSVSLLMDFFDGMNIIKRNQYPHYAFNIVIELREYNNSFYLEIYYNDTLKYNQTLETFKNILNNSQYSDMNNYCKYFVNETNNYSPNNDKNGIITVIIIFIIVCCIFFTLEYFLFSIRKKRRKKINIEKNMKEINSISINELNKMNIQSM